MIDKKENVDNKDTFLDNELLQDNEDISLKDYDIKKIKTQILNFNKVQRILFIIIILFASLLYFLYSLLFYYKSFFVGKDYNGGFYGYTYKIGSFIKQNIIDKVFLKQNNSFNNINLLNIKYDTNLSFLKKEIQEFLNSSVSYVNKKQELSQQVNELINKIDSTKLKISQLINNISNYAFLPKQIDQLIQGGDITNILYVVDGLKIMSLMSLYKYLPSYMEEFIEGPGKGFFKEKNLGCQELELVKKISYYLKRGDKDIKNFLKMCYLNPYEDDWMDCYNGEFDYYYNHILKVKDFNTKFFKYLVGFIISKLSDKGYSNIEINFNSLDPKTEQISFSTVIKTYQENLSGINFLITSVGKCSDKGLTLSSLYNGITNLRRIVNNLHVYLIITYINFLRQSHMIEGDNIKVNQLKINIKKDKEGNIYDESQFSFKVKVQPEVIREIYDFIYSNN